MLQVAAWPPGIIAAMCACDTMKCWKCYRRAGAEPQHAEPEEAHSQGRISGGGARHPVPAGHQGHAEGDADRGRPAGHPARGGRGARGRHRAPDLRHGPQQGRHRGPLRHAIRTRRHAGASAARQRNSRTSERICRARARPASPASRSRSASATRCGARARSSATSRSPCCCPTCCTMRRAMPCLAQMIDAYEAHGGNHMAVAPVPDDQSASVRHRRRG